MFFALISRARARAPPTASFSLLFLRVKYLNGFSCVKCMKSFSKVVLYTNWKREGRSCGIKWSRSRQKKVVIKVQRLLQYSNRYKLINYGSIPGNPRLSECSNTQLRKQGLTAKSANSNPTKTAIIVKLNRRIEAEDDSRMTARKTQQYR